MFRLIDVVVGFETVGDLGVVDCCCCCCDADVLRAATAAKASCCCCCCESDNECCGCNRGETAVFKRAEFGGDAVELLLVLLMRAEFDGDNDGDIGVEVVDVVVVVCCGARICGSGVVIARYIPKKIKYFELVNHKETRKRRTKNSS